MLRRKGLVTVVLGAVLVSGLAAAAAMQSHASGRYGEDTPPPKPAREVTIEGRIVDLHCFMTGHAPSSDLAKCTTDCLRAGVPAGLETETGLVMLGHGMEGATKMALPLAYQYVEVTGKMFERGGSRYIDISKVTPLETEEDSGWGDEHSESED